MGRYSEILADYDDLEAAGIFASLGRFEVIQWKVQNLYLDVTIARLAGLRCSLAVIVFSD